MKVIALGPSAQGLRRILRDLAVHICASRPVTVWAEVTTADLEGFPGRQTRRIAPANLYPAAVLRRAKGRLLVTRLLAPAGTNLAVCRQTRLTQPVTDLDPKLTATVQGVRDTGLV